MSDDLEQGGQDGGSDGATRAATLLRRLEELEAQLATAGSREVELTLLERATEIVEELSGLLERLERDTAG